MAGILSFSEYIGGTEPAILEQTYPSTQEILTLNFGEDVAGWTFEFDTQTLIVDKITYDRNTGDPNFATSTIKGYFAKAEITGAVSIVNAGAGTVAITRTGGVYTGPIIPDARLNIPLTVYSLTYTNALGERDTIRFVYIQCWEPDVAPTDPTAADGYTAITGA